MYFPDSFWIRFCALATVVGTLGLVAASCEHSEPSSDNENASPARQPKPEPTIAAGATLGEPDLPGVEHVEAALTAELEEAAKQHAGHYEIRTKHRRRDGKPIYTNRLILERSAYLLQHAHQPVNWYPYGEVALSRARREDRPIFLSIGYSTCHYCERMARESFDDPEVAAVLNAGYVAIKVDREERPDVDATYLAAVELMRGAGGWPLNVLLTPDAEPFFGATYIPPNAKARGGEGFLDLLEHMLTQYRQSPASIRASGGDVRRRMQAQTRWSRPQAMPDADALIYNARLLSDVFDEVNGGFAGAPQFPPMVELDFLLRYHRRTEDPRALAMVSLTLERMAMGALHDPIDGGFHRYAVDKDWLHPHFEKLLYTNALLASLYLDAHQVTGKELFGEIARETLEFLDRSMSSKEGAFCAGLSAESEDAEGQAVEGFYYTFDRTSLERLFPGSKGKRVASWLLPPAPQEPGASFAPALFYGLDAKGPAQTLPKALAPSIAILRELRSRRAPPHRDCTAIVEWNALAISAFVRGALVLQDDALAERAMRAADRMVASTYDEATGLRRSDRPNAPAAFLPDYGFLIAALLDLHTLRPEGNDLERAIALQQRLDRELWDSESSGYFLSGDSHGELFRREKPIFDRALPSGNAIAVANLLRLAALTSERSYRERAESTLSLFANAVRWEGTKLMAMLSALERALDVDTQIIVVRAAAGRTAGDGAREMQGLLAKTYLPNAAIYIVDSDRVDALGQKLALFEGKRATSRTTAYVCERGHCELPATEIERLRKQLRARPLVASASGKTHATPDSARTPTQPLR